MPTVAPVPGVPFWGHDDDADPLAGGALYAFAAGTDTPQATYADPQGLTLNPHPVILDDAGYAPVYLHTGIPYKLRLDDASGVQQWEMDQVYGGGGSSGLAAAGIGVGTWTVAVTPAAGAAQAAVAVFPSDVVALALSLWLEVGFGTSQGLAQVGIGTATQPERWGLLSASAGQFAPGTESTAGLFQSYSGQPQPLGAELVTLTAYGGRFDGTGRVLLTGHFLTCHPNHQPGSSYLPGLPGPATPIPLASEAGAGLVELINASEVLEDTDLTRALTIGRLSSRTSTETRGGLTRYGTDAETTGGTLRTVATHPAGVKAALDARVAAGTALSVARYAAGGGNLQSAPGVLTTANANQLVLGSNVTNLGVGSPLVVEQNAATQLVVSSGAVSGSIAPAGLLLRASRTSLAAPTPLQPGDLAGYLRFGGYADTWQNNLAALESTATETWSASARGTRLHLAHTRTGTPARTEALRIDGLGNLSTTGADVTSGLQRGVALTAGTGPSNSPPAAVQLWAANLEGAANTTGLLVRSEDGVTTRIGSGLLARKVVLVLTTQSIAVPYVMTEGESGKVFVAANGSAMVQIDLPSAIVGLTVTVMTYSGLGVRIRAAAGDGFRYGPTIGPVAGYIETAQVHQSITLIAVNAAWWLATSVVGTWTLST
jgi:hypothetical protein